MCTDRSVSRVRRESGVTLIELVMFIVIVSVGIVGILSVMNTVTAKSADPMVRKQALAVAESMLEEIELKEFANPAGGFTGASTQANRQLFDDVGDFNGFSTTGIFPIDSATVITGLENYNVAVAVAADANLGALASAQVLRITVTVTGPANTTVVLDGYRTNYAP